MGEAVPAKSNALATMGEAGALVSMIERAARDPAIDIDKLDRLLAMHDSMRAQQAEQAFNDAMAAAQGEMEPVKRDCDNPQTRSKYASFAALDRAIRPIYSRHGFGVSFNTQAPRSGQPLEIGVVAYVTGHGHTRVYSIDMPTDGKGARGGDVMTRTHATGSGVSYGRRYLMQMIFNLATEDDDGNAAGGRHQTEAPRRQEARQEQPQQQAQLGVPQKPHTIVPLKGDTYALWSKRFIEAIDACDTRAHLGDWKALNELTLGKTKAGSPQVYADIEAAIARCEARVAKPQHAPEAPTEPAGASAAESTQAKGDVPKAAGAPPTADGEVFEPKGTKENPYVKRTGLEYVAYATRWLDAAPNATVPDSAAIDVRWDAERKIRNGLGTRIEPSDIERLVEVKGAAKARAKAAPYAPPSTDKPAAVDAPTNPETFLKWANKLYAEATTSDELEIVHNRDVEPRLDELLPPDQQEVLKSYRRRAAEIEP